MKNQALLVSIRRIRVVEVDGKGACVRLDLVIARPRRGRSNLIEIASLISFARNDSGTARRYTGTGDTPLRRWEGDNR